MPYIKQEDRKIIDKSIDALSQKLNNAGEFNYAFTVLIHKYLNDSRTNYASMNEMIGMLECCKLEIYRRIVSPYEDTKISQNGDILELSFLKHMQDEYMR